MNAYQTPPTWASGQVVGRANLRIHADNDEYFNGLHRRWRPIAYGVSRAYYSGISGTIWDGYHLLRSDATNLHYHISATYDGGTTTVKLVYDYGGTNALVASATARSAGTVTTSSTAYGGTSAPYSLSSLSPGIYRVRCYFDQALGVGSCRPPFSTYTGSKRYQTPVTIVDGNQSTLLPFTRWASNDDYLYTCRPTQPAFVAYKDYWRNSGDDHYHNWEGYFRFQFSRLYWKLYLSNDSGNNRICIYLDSTVVYTFQVTAESKEGFCSLGTPDNAWHKIEVQLHRDNDDDAVIEIVWLHNAPAPSEAMTGYTALNEFTPGQYVYGNTAGQLSRLQLLSSNDSYLFSGLCFNATIGRMDWAVSKAEYYDNPGPLGVWYTLQRQQDTLYYRVADAVLKYGPSGGDREQESYNLLSCDDSSTGYQTLDLRTVTGLEYGMVYTIRGTGLHFALET